MLSLWLCTLTPCGHVQLSPGKQKQNVYKGATHLFAKDGLNHFQQLRMVVGRCRALKIYLWRSGGSHYHFQFWRLVSVKTIFFISLTFLNLPLLSLRLYFCGDILLTYSFKQTLSKFLCCLQSSCIWMAVTYNRPLFNMSKSQDN